MVMMMMVKDLPPLASLSSIYPSHHPQLFSPLLFHSHHSSSSSFGNGSVQPVAQGLDEEEDDENGYFVGLARRIVHSMLDHDEQNKIGLEVFVELRMVKKDSPDISNSPLDLSSLLLRPHDIEEEAAAVATSLSAKEHRSMKKKSKKKKRKGKQLVANASKGGAYEGRVDHSSKRGPWKDYRCNSGGSASSCAGTGVFLPRSYNTPCTLTTLTMPSCPTTNQSGPLPVSPPLEKAIVLLSPSYTALAVESQIHDINQKASSPSSSFASFCSPLEHITSDISLPMEWAY